MRKIVKKIFSFIIYIVSKLFTYDASKRLHTLLTVPYTMWIRNFIGHLGNHSLIGYPCFLEGGGRKRIYIGNNTEILGHSILGVWEKYGNQVFSPTLEIGDHCSIGEYNQISTCNKITIGNGVLTGRYVYIGDNSHGGLSVEESIIPPKERELKSKGKVVIGDNVWIGDKVTILAGVHIGDNVIIAANAVVTRDIQSNCVAAGVPATVIKSINVNL